MISVSELRPGVMFKMDGDPYVVVRYEHIKMGRGSATVKVKVRGLTSGVVVEKSFINGAKVEEAEVERRQYQYLYGDGEVYVFMNPVSFDQIEVDGTVFGDQSPYLLPSALVWLLTYQDKVIGVELPPKLAFRVVECDPGVKGDSASNVYKSAKLENGVMVKVPLFIGEGEAVIIDTRTGEYIERAKGI